MPLNRSRYFRRGQPATEECLSLAHALARIADAELLEALVNNIGTINEHGGEMFVGAQRVKLNATGHVVEPNDPGTYTTIGYAVAYNSKAQIPGSIVEPEVPYGTGSAPMEIEEIEESPNGTEPEPAEVGS